MDTVRGSSVWNLGALAAREGEPATANPYPVNNYDFVCWMNGWAFAKHMVAKEEEMEEL